jgi:geranylgeranyl diphosphate synthase type I
MFNRYKDRVEQELFATVPSAPDDQLYTLLRYHLGWANQDGEPSEAPIFQGKAMRSALCLFACEALEGDPSQALPVAAALELIHNFSLIHDDIQDGDIERRHRPTVWHLWGVPRALVAGNAMQSLADKVLLRISQLNVSPETTLKISQVLTGSCLEMIEGQCLDLEYESSTDVTTQDYLQMIACKTGSLIRAGLEMGALMAVDDPKSVQALSDFGNYLGQVFQIRDDILGIWGDESTTGKAAGNDIRRRKKTFPVVFALERSTGQAREDLLQTYNQERLEEDDVTRVLAVLDEVGAPEYSQALTENSAEQALKAAMEVNLPNWAMAEVEVLVDFLARRKF